MVNTVPLYVFGLQRDGTFNRLFITKFQHALEKTKKILPEIIEVKIAVETQNTEGTRPHYEVRANVITAKNQLVYTESGWDILKIADELCRKLEGELSKHDDNRQRESILKKETN